MTRNSSPEDPSFGGTGLECNLCLIFPFLHQRAASLTHRIAPKASALSPWLLSASGQVSALGTTRQAEQSPLRAFPGVTGEARGRTEKGSQQAPASRAQAQAPGGAHLSRQVCVNEGSSPDRPGAAIRSLASWTACSDDNHGGGDIRHPFAVPSAPSTCLQNTLGKPSWTGAL